MTLRKAGSLLHSVLRVGVLWLPCLLLLPLVFCWPNLFFRLELYAITIPASVFLHEFLHLVWIPSSAKVETVHDFFTVGIIVYGAIPPGRALVAAVAPSILLPLIGMFLFPVAKIVAFFLFLHALSLPIDLYRWYQGILGYGRS